MMVTFVSQCEKKALKRTRQVLDAFANRIGDNTWQTVITEDGLLAVKKMLRQTATKNTAVACHWLRSRSRSELVWVVGNRNKFNSRGIVPVNSTKIDIKLFMDSIMKPQNDIMYANTHLQRLDMHSFAVGHVAKKLFDNYVQNGEENNNLSNVAFIAGCLHDVGKVDQLFQNWVKKAKLKDSEEDGQHIDSKFTFKKHPRHNEISLLAFNIFEQQLDGMNTPQKEALEHAIYWHHAKPYRGKEDNLFDSPLKIYNILSNNLMNEQIGVKQVLIDAVRLVKDIQKIATAYDLSYTLLEKHCKWNSESLDEQLNDFECQFKRKGFLDFKDYSIGDNFDELVKKNRTNAHHNLLRACVITADRLVSSLSADDLNELVQGQRLDEVLLGKQETISNLVSQIEDGLSKFPDSQRTQKQKEVASKLAKIPGVAVLAGAAGCGKTKIALEWAQLKNAQKIIWVCPRVQICQGIFQELIDVYLPDAKIEIFTGEFKYTNAWDNPTNKDDYFSGDVVVTTIDQILGSIVTHTDVDSLLPFMDAHVVFDEYHEYISMEIFNLLFAELIANKNMRCNNDKRTLLISATPHYYYLEEILQIESPGKDIVEMPSFNESQYKIEFIIYNKDNRTTNPFYQSHAENTFIISNTAKTAQLGFLYCKDTENSLLFHSKYKRSDKRNLFNEVYESFKQNGSRKYSVLRAGPIVQASLNISCNHMLSEMNTPENILQRLGRLDRFGKNTNVNILKIAITDDIMRGKQSDASAKFLASLNGLQTTRAWYDYLTEKLDNKVFKLPELYQIYKDFYTSQQYKNSIKQDLESAIKNSINLLNQKVTEPIKVIKNKTEEKKPKISKNSLRGDNRFVQMAKLDVNDYKNPRFINEYAYQPPVSENEEFDNLTESTSIIQGINSAGQNNSSKNLLANMFKKHHNILGGKKPFSDNQFLSQARDPEFPIYLSYTPECLDKVGGESARHPEAIYYAVCDKQAIGTISYKTILTLTNNQKEE